MSTWLRSAQTSKLLARCGTEGVGRSQQDALACIGQVSRQLANRGGFARAIDPATMITVGVWCPTSSGFSSGDSRSVMALISRFLTCSGAVALASFDALFRSSSSHSVAATPASAISKADSNSSYSASSI